MPERKCKTTWRLLCEAVEHRLVYRLQEQENKFVAAQRQFEASNIVSGEDCASLKHFLITYRAQRTSCWASQELARAAHKHVVPPMKMGVLWCADVQKSIMSLSKMSNARHRQRNPNWNPLLRDCLLCSLWMFQTVSMIFSDCAAAKVAPKKNNQRSSTLAYEHKTHPFTKNYNTGSTSDSRSLYLW